MIDHAIKKIFNLLICEASGIVICEGDLNVQLQSKLNSSNLQNNKNGNSLIMRKLLKESGMIDVWRDLPLLLISPQRVF